MRVGYIRSLSNEFLDTISKENADEDLSECQVSTCLAVQTSFLG